VEMIKCLGTAELQNFNFFKCLLHLKRPNSFKTCLVWSRRHL